MAFHKFRALSQFVDIDGHGWTAGMVWEGDEAAYTANQATLTQAVTDGFIVQDDSGPDYSTVTATSEDAGIGTEQEAVKEKGVTSKAPAGKVRA
jgi:hypothetical protein